MYPRINKKISSSLALALLLVLLGGLSACIPGKKIPEPEPPKPVPSAVQALQYSSEKIANVSKKDVRFAQTALLKLGFKTGAVDGLWGPRSAKAIRQFEAQNDITSANGHLSELNLKWLERMTLLSRINFEDKPNRKNVVRKTGISSQLKEAAPLSQGPQLIIVDREYTVLTKPNPYSSAIKRLEPGMGIYVINQQDGWFEVESTDRKRGFLPVD